jgi:hypothetical protein
MWRFDYLLPEQASAILLEDIWMYLPSRVMHCANLFFHSPNARIRVTRRITCKIYTIPSLISWNEDPCIVASG